MAAKPSKLKWPHVLALLLLAGMVGISHARNMAMYWGQNGDDGTLVDACNSGLYAFVILSLPSTVGSSQAQVLNLTGLSSDIQACQSLDVKVLLSLGGSNSSADDAKNVANYLWDNFLGGSCRSSPLSDAVLDGINFYTESGNSANYDDLANSLSQLSGQGRKMYLTAAPHSPYPAAVKIANLDWSRAPFPRNRHNLKESSLYMYRQTTNDAKQQPKQQQDPARLATRLEKGY
ncbi:acidic endochitinase-like [Phragmites australis]|uniref:acidic endochitinase-like n=1 Tax=Phragmites australis TaxID=29695 RepID=UPI002D76D02F|nr:acidic endochitinase-like [Phragmites australis]